MAHEYPIVPEDDSEIGTIMRRDFAPAFHITYLLVGPERVVIPEYYLKFSEAIRQFQVREDDVLVISHPKTGTTWTQEMVWCIANDLDFQKAKQTLNERFPFLEQSTMIDYTSYLPDFPELVVPPYVSDSVQYTTDMKSPRFIKTHLPWSLLPQQIQDGAKKPKIIYVCRNAKDTCISYFYHNRLLEGYQGTFENFCKLFLENMLTYSPFWSHVLTFWERRHHPNVLFLKYEDMKEVHGGLCHRVIRRAMTEETVCKIHDDTEYLQDLPAVIRQTAKFLEKVLTDEQVSVLAHHLSFDSMKINRSVNREATVELKRKLGLVTTEGHFIRSGRVGEWRETMSSEVIEKFDLWIKENLQGTDLTF